MAAFREREPNVREAPLARSSLYGVLGPTGNM